MHHAAGQRHTFGDERQHLADALAFKTGFLQVEAGIHRGLSRVDEDSLGGATHALATPRQRWVTLCKPMVNGAARGREGLRQRKVQHAPPLEDRPTVNVALHRQLLSLTPLDDAARGALRAAARTLRSNNARNRPLAGKNIALMCGAPQVPAADAIAEAASSLGARVARIEPARPGVDIARLIEHLYDAVDCEALPPGFALALQERLAVPVFDGLARDDHPMLTLLQQGDADALDRRVLLQAALVTTLL
jgi:ornithine carbamoyltransferase